MLRDEGDKVIKRLFMCNHSRYLRLLGLAQERRVTKICDSNDSNIREEASLNYIGTSNDKELTYHECRIKLE